MKIGTCFTVSYQVFDPQWQFEKNPGDALEEFTTSFVKKYPGHNVFPSQMTGNVICYPSQLQEDFGSQFGNTVKKIPC